MDGARPCSSALMAVARDVADVAVVAARICDAFVQGLDVDGAALSLLTATVSGYTAHATDEVAALLEELQFSLNEGASIEAASAGRSVLVVDLTDGGQSSRWPVFAAAATELSQARAFFALPLQWGSVRLGVLALYRRRPRGLTDEQRADVATAVAVASMMLLTARTEQVAPDQQGSAWLDSVVEHRAELHQATGMVVAQLDVAAEVALARMRAHAFAEQRLLMDVAHDVMARTLVFTENSDSGRDREEEVP